MNLSRRKCFHNDRIYGSNSEKKYKEELTDDLVACGEDVWLIKVVPYGMRVIDSWRDNEEQKMQGFFKGRVRTVKNLL